MMRVRRFEERDWSAVWNIIEPVFRSGETYAYSQDISNEEAKNVWIHASCTTYIAVDEQEKILGTYYIKANQPGLGAHVCNCGYIVAPASQNKGVASAMCLHSQAEAVRQGFLAMQYNLVVSTNVGAIRLWKRHGFEVIGTLPMAFKHPKLGYVDALLMYKLLSDSWTCSPKRG